MEESIASSKLLFYRLFFSHLCIKIDTMSAGKFEGPAIGIDLGTCYSCVGVWINDHVEIIPNEQGERTTPSYVAFTDTERLVGYIAKDMEIMNPTTTVFGAKRLIGRKFSDRLVQSDINIWPFKVVCGPDDTPKIEVTFKGETKQLCVEEISAAVLSKLKANAESYLGREVKNAVITVPAYFNDAQKQATVDAGIIAGLNVMRIIVEPTAAAITYGLNQAFRSSGKKNVLVFDLGGGTFDVSLLTVENYRFEVKGISGNSHLGGEDFVNRMVTHFVREFERKHKKDLNDKPQSLRRLRAKCETAKINLSFTQAVKFDLDHIYDQIHFECEMHRGMFEILNMDLFDYCIDHVDKCLKYANMEKASVDEVVLVGGSTRIPMIQQLVREFFDGKVLCNSVHPDEAIAYGAAVQAAILCGESNEQLQDIFFSDVTPLSLGVSVRGGDMSVLIPRNTTFPTKGEKLYTTLFDDQRCVTFPVYQGEMSRTSDNILLGQFELSGIAPALKGKPSIVVSFNIDENGILNVSAEDEETNNKSDITIVSIKGRLTVDQIDNMVHQAELYKAEDEYLKQQKEAKYTLQNYVQTISMQIERLKIGSKLPNIDIETVKNAIDSGTEWLDYNSLAKVEEFEHKKKELESICKPILEKAR